jgi:mRNA-degrading endonuclease toxin of MazEF toxin-antitoxin module
VNHGELWAQDNARAYRCVLSRRDYNATGFVVSAAVGAAPAQPSPLRIPHQLGPVRIVVHVDKLLYHPSGWLSHPVGRLDDEELDELRRQLRLLLELT